MIKQYVTCNRECACHKGARYDQIECMCEWFCGYELGKDCSLEDLKGEHYEIIKSDDNHIWVLKDG